MNAKTYHAMADRTPTINDGEFVLAHTGREGTNWRAVSYLDAAENGKWKFWQTQPDAPTPPDLAGFNAWIYGNIIYPNPYEAWCAALAWERSNNA